MILAQDLLCVIVVKMLATAHLKTMRWYTLTTGNFMLARARHLNSLFDGLFIFFSFQVSSTRKNKAEASMLENPDLGVIYLQYLHAVSIGKESLSP